VVAFSDHCTHKGGPLSDGALIGCTVQCPWHGSQFDIVTGRVIAGPAQKHILTYDVVTRGDDVFVYPKRGEDRKDEEPRKVA
jgi:nitrite reductase/ring-hydroxylating ferredoxin subunit